MDAANLSLKRIALSAAFAVLLPTAAFAQPAFQLSPSSAALSGQAPVNVQVSSTTTNLGYSATVTYPNAGDLNWLCVNPNGGPSTIPIGNGGSVTGLATPDFLTLTVCGSPAPNVTTHQATVTLNETDGLGSASASIPVTYTLGSGGGGGTGSVVASPSSITETITYGTSFGPIQVALSTSSIQPIAFTVGSTPSWITWYQSSGNNGFVSAGQSAVLQITLNGGGQSESTLSTTFTVNAATGAVNIPITLNNGVVGNGGGTTGTGSLSVSPASLSWNYAASSGSAFPSPTTLSMSSTNGAINYYATATSSNGWLQVNSAYTATGQVGINPLTISPSINLGALAPGTYTGTVAISGGDESAATVTVTATINGTGSSAITINPSPISLTAAVNGSTTQATVSVTSTVSGVLSANVSGSGISVSGSGQTVNAGSPVYLTVSGTPTGLSNATYQGTLNVSVADNSTSAQINFVVGTGNNSGGGTNAAATPSQLTFYYEPNTNMPTSQTQQVWLSGSGSFTLSSSTTNTSDNWLQVTPTSGTLPSLISISVSPFGLASSTYNGQIAIDNTSTGQTTTVGVSMVVNGITTLYASPGDWVFNYISGISNGYQSQPITIAASDGTSVPVSVTVSNASSTPWLTVSGSGNTPLAITAIVNSNNLANGVYSGSILITGGNNSLAVPIVLTVTGSSVTTGTGPLTLGASSLTLQAVLNGAAVAQAVSVNAASSTTFTVSSSGTSNGITWLSVNPFGTTATPATITVTASPAGLPAATYSGTVSLSANGSTQTIPITFVVGSNNGGTSVVVTANGGTSTSPSLTFTASSVGATLPAQSLSVTSTSGESSVLFTASTSASWIQLGTVSGTQYSTPYQLTVTANTAGLAAGTYNNTITISPSGGTAVSIPVTLTIAGAPGISVTSSSLSFAYAAGGATPATQTVPVTVSNGTSASYTATASSTPSAWLQVSPGSGTAPGNLTVSINPSGLGAGSYSGTITVAGASGATGSATVNVTLTVTVPLPTVTAVVNAASFINESISPGEIITIGGTNIGPSTAQSFTVSNNLVPSSLGGVQVLINGYLAPVLYVSSTQINAIVPYEIAGILNPTVLVETNVSANSPAGTSSNGFTVNSAATAPGIFTANGSGTGPGAILNSDSSVNTASNPAARGSVIQVFLTGEGQTQPKGIDGWVTTAPYPTPLLPLAITVGGSPANYEFAGEAPGLVSGVLQLNVIIPSTLTSTGAVPLNVSIGSGVTQGGVTVNIK